MKVYLILFPKRKQFTVNHKRPVNLDLGSLKFPPMAIASILHRTSGIVLFLLFPVMLYLLSLSLHSGATFNQLQHMLVNPVWKLLLWAFNMALIYHILAGIRHLLIDFGFGEGLSAGRNSANFVIALAIILSVLLGVWIW